MGRLEDEFKERPNISTSYERKALLKALEKPAPSFDYTPDGIEYTRIHYDLQRWQARRINHLDSVLSKNSHVMRKQFDQAR